MDWLLSYGAPNWVVIAVSACWFLVFIMYWVNVLRARR